MSNARIAELKVGRPVEGTYAVVRAQRRLTRNGDPYLVLELSDSTGTITANVWDNADHWLQLIRPGDRVRAVGKPTMYRERLQLDVRRIDRIDADSTDVSDVGFVPSARRPLEDLVGELEFLVNDIDSPHLQSLVGHLWIDGPHAQELQRSPATESEHHAWLGGLVEHSVGVALTSLAVAERYEFLNRPVLLSAALLHDVGRARELGIHGSIVADPEGHLVGHVLLAHEMLMEARTATGLGELTDWAALLHAISMHHGPIDRCRTREAMVVASANALDARLGHSR